MENMRERRAIDERANTGLVMYEDFPPIADWTSESNSHVLIVHLPDFKKEELKVKVDNNGRLAVGGERQLSENKYKRFRQIYSLPIDSDIDKISGKFDGDVLLIIIPKKENVIKEEPEEHHSFPDGIPEKHKQESSKTEEKPEGDPKQETTTTTEEKPNKDGKDNDVIHDHGNEVHEEGNTEEGAENKWKCGLHEDFYPIADWTNNSNSHILRVQLPGFKKEELKVEVDNNGRLAVSGKRQLSDNKYKRFKHICSLPVDSDINKISSKFDSGILFVIIPKKKNVIKGEPVEEHPTAEGIAEEQKQDTSKTEEKPDGDPKQETTTTTEEKPSKDGKDNDVIHDHGNGVDEEGNREGVENKWKCGLHEDFHPIANWTNNSNSHVLLVELPGIKKEKLKVELNNNGRLEVSGERQLTENKYKRFKQIYSLPVDSDIDKISGIFDGGILSVIIPMKENVIEEEPEEHHPVADGIAEEQKLETSKTEEKPEGVPKQETTTTTEEKPNEDGKDNDVIHDHGNGVHEEGNGEEGAENKWKCGLHEDFHPIANWTNDSNDHVLLVQLPGFKKEELKIEVDNSGRLAVSGERQFSENKYKRFKEIYSLPTDSDIDKISGKLDGGVLFVIIPKKEYVIEKEPKEHHRIADEISEKQKHETSKTVEKPEKTPKQDTTTTTEEKPKKDGKDNDVKHDHGNGIREERKREEDAGNKWKHGLNTSVREKEEKRSKFGFAKRAIERIAQIKGVVFAAILKLAVGFGLRGTSEERDREKTGQRMR